MLRIWLIGWTVVAAVAASAATPSFAEARGFRLRLGVGTAAAATADPITPRATEHVAAAGVALPIAPAAGAAANAAPRPGMPQRDPIAALTPVSVAPAPARAKPSPQALRVAGSWCPSGRIVGAGAGFCEVN